jgi:hypothetical protein
MPGSMPSAAGLLTEPRPLLETWTHQFSIGPSTGMAGWWTPC